MKSKKIWALSILVLVVAAVVYNLRSTKPTQNHEAQFENQLATEDDFTPEAENFHNNPDEAAKHNHALPVKSLTTEEQSAQQEFIESALAKLPVSERESLLYLTEIMTENSPQGEVFENVVAKLEAKGMAPFLMKDENPDTGTMTVIRTKKTLPGTRYFHAQYFEGENGQKFAQHISFEFRPGTTSFDGVKAALMKQFKIQSAPTLEKKDFISWNQDGHTIWAKIQTKEDFAHDPFNAHDDNDVGTIRVAKEIEIHDHAAPVFHAPLEASEEE